ncbi:extracellular solute-binding protein [Anaerobacillus sp. CMMVII]|uniref:extracellular solute-binding protein n=1 Tax=Anaerobacillus sp. CMMVII TaxID=2755588 RepID=UPI0021B75A94|nr:extracellular solute-binding protein [Anaerobacillus sp. CMMVII]MCT8136561.1 extracellular solute-binding protein [Anaerobacillus sp. CMMVII]
MNKVIKFFLFAILSVSLLLVAACGGNEEPKTATPSEPQVGAGQEEGTGKLVVYSSRNEKFVEDLLAKFTADTGIEVVALHGASANKISEERGNVQADIFISNDVGELEFLRMEGLLEGFEPELIDTIDAKYRAQDNSWFALSARTRVLMYNKDLITEEEMPKTVWELTDAKWKDQFAITRGGNGSMIGHVTALRQEWGDEQVVEWLNALGENAGAIMQGHGDIRKAVGAGEFKFGLVNNYYYHQQLVEPTDNNVGVIYPDQDGMGAVVNAAGVGLIKGGPNAVDARVFLNWILEDENQREFSYASMEVPINPNIEAIPGAASITDYKTHDMPLSKLGEVWADTKSIIENSGLGLEIR